MHPVRRLAAFLAAAALLASASAARADSIHFGFHLLQKDDKGGGTPPPAPPTLSDVAGPSAAVTLPDLLALAIKQAPELQRAEIDLEIADAQIEQARALDDYTVEAALTGSAAPSLYGGDLSGSISRVLSGGTLIKLEADTGYGRVEACDPVSMACAWGDSFSDSVTATIIQPLMEGRGAAIVRASERRARIARDVAGLTRYQAALAVVRDVVSAYWELVFAQRDLEIRVSSLDLANERLRRTQAGIKGGGLARTEALEVEQVVATREEEVLGSELTVIERSIALRRLVGMEIGPQELGLSTATELGVPGKSWDLDALLADAYKTSPELALLAEKGKDATIEIEVTENGVLPSLDLSLVGGPIGKDDTFGGAVKNTVTFDDFAATVALTYQHSLGNHEAKGAARAARAERLKITVDESDTRNQIAESLAEAVLLAESASRRVEIAGRAIELAEQNIVAEQSRYGLGKSTNFDVLQRQDELKQAQLRQARAIIDWHKASAVIAAISGDLLTEYGITLPD